MAVNTSRSAATTLDDIINELKLSYDSSVGLLDGDNVRQIPSVNNLLNLSKLLNNLSKDLKAVEEVDTKVLSILGEKLLASTSDTKSTKEDGLDIEETKKDKSKNGKRELEDIKEESKKKQKIKSEVDDKDIEMVDPENVQDIEELEAEQAIEEDNVPDNEHSKVKEEDEDEDDDEEEEKEEGAKEEDQTEAVTSRERLNSSDDPIPPIQTGHYTQDNDTRLKNPKSEFVKPQTVSASAIAELGLFSEDNNGLETQGKEYLKKKYGVASYPENDLKDLLPGEIPNIDFSKNKPPSNQVQFTTFQSYIESFYRLFSNEDLKFLNEKNIIPPGFEKMNYDPDVSPYIIPKLGQFYADAWTEEDASLASKLNSPAFQQISPDTYKPKGTINDLEEDKLATEDISCGPLSSRLLSAVLSIHEGVEESEENGEIKTERNIEDNLGIDMDENIATNIKVDPDFDGAADSNDFHSIEERLKRELKYIGIFMNLPNDEDESKSKLSLNGRPIKSETRSGSIIDTDDWVKNKEDDEVSAEIRMLQKQLKSAVARNRLNKKKLIPVVEEQIAYQEYCTILEDLDKQVDQAYMKRLKSKGKKKKANEKVELTPAQQQAMNASVRSTLDKRKRWMENIGQLFASAEIMKRVPSESLLDGDLEEEVDEEANDVAQDVIQDNS